MAVKTFRCQNCGKTVTEYPALSRKDNKTEICSICEMIEAIEEWLGEIPKYKPEV